MRGAEVDWQRFVGYISCRDVLTRTLNDYNNIRYDKFTTRSGASDLVELHVRRERHTENQQRKRRADELQGGDSDTATTIDVVTPDKKRRVEDGEIAPRQSLTPMHSQYADDVDDSLEIVSQTSTTTGSTTTTNTNDDKCVNCGSTSKNKQCSHQCCASCCSELPATCAVTGHKARKPRVSEQTIATIRQAAENHLDISCAYFSKEHPSSKPGDDIRRSFRLDRILPSSLVLVSQASAATTRSSQVKAAATGKSSTTTVGTNAMSMRSDGCLIIAVNGKPATQADQDDASDQHDENWV